MYEQRPPAGEAFDILDEMKESKQKIVLGMSGGVDSATAAAILLRGGYEVIGVTCLFLDDEASRASAADAAAVCEKLGIAHHVHDCVQAFRESVIDPFVCAYAKGLTPSPCVGCNATCKIPALIEVADKLGCQKVATGHYARIAQLTDNDRFVVKVALDPDKDQSYMLGLLSQAQLGRLVLPLGAITKTEVRLLARELGLPVADKGESQDICFVEDSYVDLLVQRGVKGSPGNIVNVKGAVLGQHDGLERYTIGQRKGIGIGGAGEPYYVIAKRSDKNELVVGFQAETMMDRFAVRDENWQAFKQPPVPLECMCKVRYRSRPVPCIVEALGDGACVLLRSSQSITAPGQYAAFYQGDTLLGAACIDSVSDCAPFQEG